DGIRDRNVTGVQTCALPIWFRCGCSRANPLQATTPRRPVVGLPRMRAPPRDATMTMTAATVGPQRYQERYVARLESVMQARRDRSEERRVGKECRARGREE